MTPLLSRFDDESVCSGSSAAMDLYSVYCRRYFDPDDAATWVDHRALSVVGVWGARGGKRGDMV